MKPLLPRKSLSEQVAEAVSAEISDGRIKLGEMLSETRIAQGLGVSRTPVREAFSHLEFRGLLVTKPQVGTFVFDPTANDIRDLFEMRSCLELQGFQSSQQGDDQRLAGTLLDLSDQMDDAFRAGDDTGYMNLDHAFHGAFVSYSGNRLLSKLYDPIALKLRALTNNDLIKRIVDETSHEEHLSIARSLGQNQFDKARSIVSQHLMRADLAFARI